MQGNHPHPPFDLPGWLQKDKYCPACRRSLSVHATLDICTIGLDCQNKHHFVVTLYEPKMQESASVRSVNLPRAVDEKATIQYWLTEWKARSRLNTQLADMLRRIVE